MNGGQIFTVVLFAVIFALVVAVVLLPDTSHVRKKIMAAAKWLSDLDKPPSDLPERLSVPHLDRAVRTGPNTTTPHLIACQACAHMIGPQAETCPQCGSPNEWMHPQVKKIMDGASQLGVERRFMYWGKGAEVWGESVYHSPLAVIGVVVVFCLGLISGLFSSFFGPIVGGVLSVVVWRGTAKTDTFKANLLKQEWTSTNDKFWAPVYTFLYPVGNQPKQR